MRDRREGSRDSSVASSFRMTETDIDFENALAELANDEAVQLNRSPLGSKKDHLENVVDIQRIRKQTSVRKVLFHEQIGSTSDEAIRYVSVASNPCPVVILTNLQMSGRGQRARNWHSKPGSLALSLGMDVDHIKTSKTLIPLAVGISVCQAVEQIARLSNVQIKWPNDIIIDDKKAGGILIEAVGSDRVVIGIGLNVNNNVSEFAAWEKGLLEPVAIKDARGGEPTSLTDLAVACVHFVCENLACSNSDQNTLEAFSRFSLLSNHHIEVELPGREVVSGLYAGIAPCGSLLLVKETRHDEPMKVASGRIRRIN